MPAHAGFLLSSMKNIPVDLIIAGITFISRKASRFIYIRQFYFQICDGFKVMVDFSRVYLSLLRSGVQTLFLLWCVCSASWLCGLAIKNPVGSAYSDAIIQV